MSVFFAVLIIIAVVILLWLFATMPSIKKNKDIEELGVVPFAHRGLHSAEHHVPENSLLAFEKAINLGVGIEFDVHISLNGTPIVMHDGSVDRTTNGKGEIHKMSDNELASLNLEGTDQKIPLFADVLSLVDGKVPLLIELKSDGGNRKELCENCFKLLDNYKGKFIVESFDPRILQYIKRHRKRIARGQLVAGEGVSPPILQFILKHLLLNFLSRPHFIAYDNRYIKTAFAPKFYQLVLDCKLYAWTITKMQDFKQLMSHNISCIFEGFEPK